MNRIAIIWIISFSIWLVTTVLNEKNRQEIDNISERCKNLELHFINSSLIIEIKQIRIDFLISSNSKRNVQQLVSELNNSETKAQSGKREANEVCEAVSRSKRNQSIWASFTNAMAALSGLIAGYWLSMQSNFPQPPSAKKRTSVRKPVQRKKPTDV